MFFIISDIEFDTLPGGERGMNRNVSKISKCVGAGSDGAVSTRSGGTRNISIFSIFHLVRAELQSDRVTV